MSANLLSVTEHYVRPGNEAMVTTLASFPDLHMFVTCSLGLEKSYIPTSTKMDEAKKSPIYNTFAKEICDDNCKLSPSEDGSEVGDDPLW